MQILLRWAISAGALYVTIYLLQLFGQAKMQASEWYVWFFAVIVMALVNAFIRPIARLLTAPLNCVTFGIVGVLVNGAMFWLVSAITNAFTVTLLGAVIGAILVGAISGIVSDVLIRDDER